jgi:HAD superfamily hydrolase (TIGR01549 family)
MAGGSLKSLTSRGVRAVLFDVDGTLYAQTPLRLLMAAELALDGIRSGSLQRTRRVARVIGTFRWTREELRSVSDASLLLEELQFERTSARVGIAIHEVRAVVDEWIMERPLKHLSRVRRRGLTALLETLAERGIQIGALSDYPTDAKLRALGVAKYFSLGLCTTDRAVNAFKPHPKGFRQACEAWGVAPQEVLYVGDRPETDGAGAAAAGMRCVIVGGAGDGGRRQAGRHSTVRSFADIARDVVHG